MAARWTPEDAEIIWWQARRMVKATVTLRKLTIWFHINQAAVWPREAYQVSQTWVASLNV